MKISITCDSKYEAQKFASLIFIKEGKETYITSILNVLCLNCNEIRQPTSKPKKDSSKPKQKKSRHFPR